METAISLKPETYFLITKWVSLFKPEMGLLIQTGNGPAYSNLTKFERIETIGVALAAAVVKGHATFLGVVKIPKISILII